MKLRYFWVRILLGMLNKIKLIKDKLGKWFWPVIVILVIIILKFTVFKAKPLEIKVEKAKKGSLTETVSVTGRVKADNYANLTFQGSGRVAWVNVKEGQKVKKGQAIAGLDTVILNASYQQALNNYKNYQAVAGSVLDSVKDHSGDETFAQKATRTTAEVNRDNAYDALRAAEQNLRYATIFSPFNGVMASVNPSFAGSNVTSATASYIVIDPSTTYFSGELSESDLPKVKLGQKVKIKLDAYPDEEFDAKVENIGVVAFTSSTGGNAYSIRFGLPENKDFKFRVGMEGDSDIILSTIDNIIKTSFNSVVNEDSIDYVWVYDSGKIKKQKVKIGASSASEVEVLEGLSEGQEIVIDPSSKLVDGQKVKAD